MGHKLSGEQGHECKTEHGDSGCQVMDLEHFHGNVGLDYGQKQKYDQWESQTEEDGKRIPEHLLQGPACER